MIAARLIQQTIFGIVKLTKDWIFKSEREKNMCTELFRNFLKRSRLEIR
jgi:hypothetical protein